VRVNRLDLDPGRLRQREATDTRSERDQAERPDAELLRAAEGALGRRADHLGRRRPVEAHGRRVDHPASRQRAGAGGHRLPQLDRSQAVALLLDLAPAGADDRAGDPAPVSEVGVRRVRDRVDLEPRDVALEDLQLGHWTN
jgi:hypothetical protein